MIKFHDISYAQGLYNMDADPNPIIFMKMSGFYYGSKTGYYDDQAARNYNNAVRLGKFRGLYHFAGGADSAIEADFFVGACSPLADGDLLILDYELTAAMSPPADPGAWCVAFVERVKERTGKYPLFYTYASMLAEHDFSAVLARCGLWIADYAVSPNDIVPTGGHPYIIHQFQGSPLDTNASFVDIPTLEKYAYTSSQPQSQPPATPPQPEPTTTTTTTTTSAPEPTPEPTTTTTTTTVVVVEPPAPTTTTTTTEAPKPAQPGPIINDPLPPVKPIPPIVITTYPPLDFGKDDVIRGITLAEAVLARAFNTFWQTFVAILVPTLTGFTTNILNINSFSALKAFLLSVSLALVAAVLSALKNTIKPPTEVIKK